MRKRIILAIIAILLIALAIGTVNFTQNILPGILRQEITAKMSGLTGSNVIAGDVAFSLLRGAKVSGLIIFEKDDPKKVLMFARECSATLLIIPSIKENRIIVPYIKVEDAHFHLVRHKDNTFNIGYLIDKMGQPSNSGKAPQIFVKGIQVKNSSILFTDESFSAPVQTRLNIDEAAANISPDKTVFKIYSNVLRNNEKTNLSAKGSYVFSRRTLQVEVAAGKVNLKAYDEYLKSIPVTLIESNIEKSRFNIYADENELRASMDLDIAAISAQKNDIMFSDKGSRATVTVAMPMAKNDNAGFSCEGSVKINNADISGLPNIGKASNIAGNIKFKGPDIVFEDLSCAALDTPIKIKGEIKANVLNLDADGDFDLDKLKILLPRDAEVPPHEVIGRAKLALHVFSDLSKGQAPVFSGEAEVNDVALKITENNQVFQTKNGRIKFNTTDEDLQWHFASVRYQDQEYSFDGRLKGFKTPVINAMVIGKDLKLQADLKKEENELDFSALKGRFKNAAFDLAGQWDLKEDFSVKGTVLLDLKDTPNLFPQAKDVFEKSKLSGPCRIVAEIYGPLKDSRLWNVKARAQSTAVRSYGITFTNVELDYTQIKDECFINSLSFNAYNGKGVVKGKFQLRDGKGLPYSLRCQLKDIDLNLLKSDTPLKDKALSGSLSINASIEAPNLDLSSIKGLGELSIANGNIWEFNPLKGLGDFLFIPRFSNIVFTQAHGDFQVRDGLVETDNLELLSPELGLIVEGKIFFSGELSLLVNTQVPHVSKAASLTAIKISGTVKDPKYKLQPIAENIMKKLGDIFSGITP